MSSRYHRAVRRATAMNMRPAPSNPPYATRSTLNGFPSTADAEDESLRFFEIASHEKLRVLARCQKYPAVGPDGVSYVCKVRVYVINVRDAERYDYLALVREGDIWQAHPWCSKIAAIEGKIRPEGTFELDWWVWFPQAVPYVGAPWASQRTALSDRLARVMVRAMVDVAEQGLKERIHPDTPVVHPPLPEARAYYAQTYGFRATGPAMMESSWRVLDHAASEVLASNVHAAVVNVPLNEERTEFKVYRYMSGVYRLP